METLQSRLMDGPVILARATLPELTGSRGLQFLGWAILALMLLCACAAFGLFVGALIRAEWSYLPWLFCGPACWLPAFWIAWFRDRRKHRETEMKANLRQLLAFTKSGMFGKLVAGRGRVAWLSEPGIYMTASAEEGEHLSWEEYESYSITTSEPSDYQVTLWRKSASLDWTERLAVVPLMLGGLVMEFVLGIHGYLHTGPHNDVLATLFTAFFLLFGLAGLARLHRIQRHGHFYKLPKNRVADWVFHVNPQYVSLDELTTFLNRYLVEEA